MSPRPDAALSNSLNPPVDVFLMQVALDEANDRAYVYFYRCVRDSERDRRQPSLERPPRLHRYGVDTEYVP
jgi:hypothetical protein